MGNMVHKIIHPAFSPSTNKFQSLNFNQTLHLLCLCLIGILLPTIVEYSAFIMYLPMDHVHTPIVPDLCILLKQVAAVKLRSTNSTAFEILAVM